MIKSHEPDYALLFIVFILLVFGLVMVASASIVKGLLEFGDGYYYVKHQFLYGVLPGLFFLFLAERIYYRNWVKMVLPLLALIFLLLLAVFIPSVGFTHGGAKRWLALGFFSFQPSELAKLLFIIYLAAWFDKQRNKITDVKKTLIPFLITAGALSFLIYKQPNLGMLIIVVLSSLTLFFIAGARLSHILGLVLSFVFFIIAAINFASYRMNRFMAYLDPNTDLQGIGWQINQAILGVGSGGLWGKGLGWSGQKYNYLPEPFGDSIFAIIGEELGFIGVLVLIFIFFLFIWRCYAISKNAPDKFSKLLVIGITTIIVLQFFLNIGAIIRLVPLTGVPLPFISYGGSSLVSLLLGIGIILNISKYTTDRFIRNKR